MYLMVLALGRASAVDRYRAALLLLALWYGLSAFRDARRARKMGLEFFQTAHAAGAGSFGFFAAGMALYKLRHTRILDGRIALVALRSDLVPQQSLLRQFITLFPVFRVLSGHYGSF